MEEDLIERENMKDNISVDSIKTLSSVNSSHKGLLR
jgi:hypothetical protein